MDRGKGYSGILKPVECENHPWSPGNVYASRNVIRKHSGPYRAAIPAKIADLDFVTLLDGQVHADADEATQQLVRFDQYLAARSDGDSGELAPMSSILLRTESASSSQIENLTVGARQLALAELGEQASRNAGLVKANVHAMEAATELADDFSVETILEMHRRLLDAVDPEAGNLRTQQVWIGGSGVGPHLASFVPPHQSRVVKAIDDLVEFCHRDDLSPLIQIAIAHAQFETIHPFTDGNGRTARALVQAMLKGSGLTVHTTVPISAGLLVDIDRYFEALTAFRESDPVPIVSEFSRAAGYAAVEGRALIDDLNLIRTESASRIIARADSAAWGLNDLLIRQPVVNTAYVAEQLGISKVTAQTSINKLEAVGTLTESTKKVRHRVWQANDVLARLDDFAAQIKRP